MQKYDYYIFIKHFVYFIYYFSEFEMTEMETADPESDVEEVVATSSSDLPSDATASSSVPPPEKVDNRLTPGCR